MARDVRNLLVNKIHDDALQRLAREHLSGRMVDIGCGTKPYREMLAPYVEDHVGIDHADSLHEASNVDLQGTAYRIPADDASFDSAICTAVLEHLEEPEQALRETYRVLAPGGVAIYSIPFIWHLHEEPRDFYRFSKYGIQYLFEKVGFDSIETEALSGFWVTFGQLLVYNLHRFNRGPLRFVPVIPAIGLVIQATSYLLDKIDKSEQWTWMYIVVARKPGSSQTP